MQRILPLAVLSLLSLAPAQQRVLQQADLPLRAAAAQGLQAQLAADRLSAAEPAPRLQFFAGGIAAVAEQLPCGSRARTRLADALAAADDDRARPERARSSLRLAVGDLLDDLAFTPVKEADLPQGFPGFAAVDELELRDYPAYRMVRTTMRGGAMGAFWPLFRHIESHGIAMTTPVQMDWNAPGDDERQRAQTMAFLYGSKDLGAPGVDGKVEVVDVPAVTVLSIGARGSDSPQSVARLQQRLEQWLAGQSTWVRAGTMRTMGYNSPSVFGDRRYYEVQLPVRRVSKGRILV